MQDAVAETLLVPLIMELCVDFYNPFNAEAYSFVQSTRTQFFLKITQTLSCWYSLDSSR